MYEAHFGLEHGRSARRSARRHMLRYRAATPCCVGCIMRSSTARDRRFCSGRRAQAKPCWHDGWRASCGR